MDYAEVSRGPRAFGHQCAPSAHGASQPTTACLKTSLGRLNYRLYSLNCLIRSLTAPLDGSLHHGPGIVHALIVWAPPEGPLRPFLMVLPPGNLERKESPALQEDLASTALGFNYQA